MQGGVPQAASTADILGCAVVVGPIARDKPAGTAAPFQSSRAQGRESPGLILHQDLLPSVSHQGQVCNGLPPSLSSKSCLCQALVRGRGLGLASTCLLRDCLADTSRKSVFLTQQVGVRVLMVLNHSLHDSLLHLELLYQIHNLKLPYAQNY